MRRIEISFTAGIGARAALIGRSPSCCDAPDARRSPISIQMIWTPRQNRTEALPRLRRWRGRLVRARRLSRRTIVEMLVSGAVIVLKMFVMSAMMVLRFEMAAPIVTVVTFAVVTAVTSQGQGVRSEQDRDDAREQSPARHGASSNTRWERMPHYHQSEWWWWQDRSQSRDRKG